MESRIIFASNCPSQKWHEVISHLPGRQAAEEKVVKQGVRAAAVACQDDEIREMLWLLQSPELYL